MTKKNARVPKLRFPEFRAGTAWAPKLLGSLFSERKEVGYTDLRLLSLMDKEGIIPQEDSNRKNNASGDLSKYLRVVPGDIAYNTMRMWEGRSALSKLEGIVSPAYTICRPSQEANSLFFSYYFKTPQLIEQFARYSQGLVKDTLNLKFEAFSQIPVAIPCDSAEQQKIAECLSSVDELIAAQARKVDALKTHKKGLMQQLFPREGETQPQLRFPEFRAMQGWHKRELGDTLSTVSNGLALDQGTGANGYRVTRIETISNGTIDMEKVGLIQTSEDISNYKLRVGDILYSNINSIAHIGKSVFMDRDYDLYHGMNLLRLEVKRSQYDPKFIFYTINTESVRSSFRQRANKAVNQASINQTELRRTDVTLPLMHEQQRIAKCISSLDSLISLESQKLEALRLHKRGLMQQLLV